MPTTHRRPLTHALTLLAVALVAGLVLTISPAATSSAKAVSMQAGQRVVSVAASRKGSPYVWGATGPHRFDCSGLTQWVFRKVGKHLPRVSGSQYGATQHIRGADRRPGDLVFFHSGRHVFHVGIYAGNSTIWHAPHTGARVRKEHIWTRAVWYGRVR